MRNKTLCLQKKYGYRLDAPRMIQKVMRIRMKTNPSEPGICTSNLLRQNARGDLQLLPALQTMNAQIKQRAVLTQHFDYSTQIYAVQEIFFLFRLFRFCLFRFRLKPSQKRPDFVPV